MFFTKTQDVVDKPRTRVYNWHILKMKGAFSYA